MIKSVTRPVPLEFEYRSSTLHNSVTSLLDSDKAPIYLVHFTQKEATEAAQNYLALDPLSICQSTRARNDASSNRPSANGVTSAGIEPENMENALHRLGFEPKRWRQIGPASISCPVC